MALPLAARDCGCRPGDCAAVAVAAARQTAGAAVGRETMGEAMNSWRIAQRCSSDLTWFNFSMLPSSHGKIYGIYSTKAEGPL